MNCRSYTKHRFHKLIQLLGGIMTLSQESAERDGVPCKSISVVSNLEHIKWSVTSILHHRLGL
jgi:hypothetical protein